MKHNEWENDAFDELLRDALASDAAPSEDFTERLMERVRRTPQEKAKNRPYKKILAAVAACAVIAIAIPLALPRMGSSADTAAQIMNGADSAAEDIADDADRNQPLMMIPSAAEDTGSNEKIASDGADETETLTLTGEDAQTALAALDAMDIQPTETEHDRYTYDLTEQQAQELGETVDALYGVEGGLTLVLEVAE